MILGKQLRKLMRDDQLSFKELAEQTGLKRTSLQDWVRGISPRNLDDVSKIAAYFDVSFEFLLFGNLGNNQNTPKNAVPMILSKQIRRLVDEMQLTVSDLSEATGIASSTIRTWEAGASPRNMSDLLKIAKYFSVSLEFLLFGEEECHPIKPTETAVVQDSAIAHRTRNLEEKLQAALDRITQLSEQVSKLSTVISEKQKEIPTPEDGHQDIVGARIHQIPTMFSPRKFLQRHSRFRKKIPKIVIKKGLTATILDLLRAHPLGVTERIVFRHMTLQGWSEASVRSMVWQLLNKKHSIIKRDDKYFIAQQSKFAKGVNE